MGKRFEEIDLYGNREIQLNLFTSIENSKSLDGKSFWPKYAEGNKYLREILENPSEFTGIDFEFDPKTNKPTITGLANHNLAASAPYSKDVVDFIVKVAELGMTRLVGYSVIGAEKEVIEKVLGREISLDCFEDGMITHFLLNQDLVKQSSGGKVGGEKGSLGFLNLWTMNTFYCGLPQFKMCRGFTCTGPCPSHKVFGYNAMDSYVARDGFMEMLKEMEEKGVPYQFYRDLLKVSYIAHLMQKGGVRVDRDLIARLDKISDDEKEKLFPYTQSGKTKKYEYFNPNAPAAAINYFKKHKIFLEKFNAEAIEKALTELADNNDVGLTEFVQGIDSHSLPYQLLIKAYQYKGAGKGFKSWFDDKFFGDDGLMHPRFIVIGTSTGRFSSKDPNFQNIPGYDEDTPQAEQSPFAQARVAIIPKKDDQCLIKADKSNLEFRMCMWYAGFDTYQIEKDAFQWIVNVSEGAFKDAAKLLGKTERAVAKSVAHGSNYGEGIILLKEEDLAKPKIKAAIKMGAIVPYYDWEYAGGIIAFSGVNLAQRIFKDTSLEARAKANDLLEGKYFGKFKIIREWQQRVLQEIEKTGILKSATGRFIRLQDEPLECAKQAFSFLGQGTSADHVQGDMINFFDEYGMDGVPLLQVHDELVFEKPKVWDDAQCIEFLSVMEREDKRIKGFWCPVKMYRGANWAQIKRIK